MRLLKALDARGAAARGNAFEEGRVVVRKTRSDAASAGKDAGGATGVSLGGGEHPQAALDALLARDLVAIRGADFVISPAGRALLRRQAAHGEGLDATEGFAAQHRRTQMKTLDGGARARVNRDESPLARLAARRDANGAPLIDAARLQAGERLRNDLTLAGIMPGIGLDWDRFGAGAGGGSGARAADPTQTRIAARQRVARIVERLGAEDADLLVDLCGFLKPIAEIERERGWPVRSAKVVIARALGRLAEHYGIAAQARGPETARRILAWAAP
ncbi:MAG: ATPase [Salinarimonadaceae bacterium]|nr:MAG: ATPase [Salinarimonadaceae bacterium]